MIGVSIGIGPKWYEVAEKAAERMSAMTGLRCTVINEWHGMPLEHPSWMKCRILDIFPSEDEFLYFDADIWCVKKWNPADHLNGFTGVVEPSHAAIDKECQAFNLKPEDYINGGLLLFSRSDSNVFRGALAMHGMQHGRYYDQTPLNKALMSTDNRSYLPAKFNAIAHRGVYEADFNGVGESEVVNFHFCSTGDPYKIMELQNER